MGSYVEAPMQEMPVKRALCGAVGCQVEVWWCPWPGPRLARKCRKIGHSGQATQAATQLSTQGEPGEGMRGKRVNPRPCGRVEGSARSRARETRPLRGKCEGNVTLKLGKTGKERPPSPPALAALPAAHGPQVSAVGDAADIGVVAALGDEAQASAAVGTGLHPSLLCGPPSAQKSPQ
jgi:hypothetical protein